MASPPVLQARHAIVAQGHETRRIVAGRKLHFAPTGSDQQE